jgi:DNA-directed RNA polymerase subunit N (RpoN/RPB10)
MIIPIRCYTCAMVIANKWVIYQELLKTMSAKEALKILNLERYCCRRMLLTHVEIIDKLLKFDHYDHKIPNHNAQQNDNTDQNVDVDTGEVEKMDIDTPSVMDTLDALDALEVNE